MTVSFGVLCIWALAANIAALFPSRHHHWPAAYVLTATGIPLLAWVLYESPPMLAMGAILMWVSVLRWPLLYFGRWVRRKLT